MKPILLAGLALLFAAAGCGGTADVQIINNTSSYVHGDAGDTKYGINAGTSTWRTVKVGSTFSPQSDIKLVAKIHSDWRDISPVVGTTSRTMSMSADEKYSWEVFTTSSGQPAFRLVGMSAGRSPLAP